MEALIAFLPSPADGAIGALDWTSAERKRLAKKSVASCCFKCGRICDLLPELEAGEEKRCKPASRFEKEIEALRLAQAANEAKNEKKSGSEEKQSETVVDEKTEVGKSSEEQTSGDAVSNGEAAAVEPIAVEDKSAPQMEPEENSSTEEVPDLAEEEPQQTTPTIEPQTDDIQVDNDAGVLNEAADDEEELENDDASQEIVQEEPEAAHQIPEVAVAEAPNQVESMDIEFLTGPLLNITIVVLVVACYLLARRLVTVRNELIGLQVGFHAGSEL